MNCNCCASQHLHTVSVCLCLCRAVSVSVSGCQHCIRFRYFGSIRADSYSKCLLKIKTPCQSRAIALLCVFEIKTVSNRKTDKECEAEREKSCKLQFNCWSKPALTDTHLCALDTCRSLAASPSLPPSFSLPLSLCLMLCTQLCKLSEKCAELTEAQ